MSPELETLDQLLGGDLSLTIVRRLYPDAESFKRGVLGLLSSGDVRIVTIDQDDVPKWRWKELFVDDTVMKDLGCLRMTITAQGARRVA
jgi:hypothetical protein